MLGVSAREDLEQLGDPWLGQDKREGTTVS